MTILTRTIETPCLRICRMEPVHSLCAGCGRTLDEIARWASFSADERRSIMAHLPARLAALAEGA